MELRQLPKEIQEKRKLSYLFKEFDDTNLARIVLNFATDDEIADRVIGFFVEGSALVYPPKSYFVAIVYAACMLKYFPEHFKDIVEPLKCVDLLDNDDFFSPYMSKTAPIYNKVLQWLERERIEILDYASTEKTHNYFREEFLITEGELVGKC